MQKILTFAWKQIHTVYSDPSLLMLMFATPLALATIIGLAFGGAGGELTINNIPIAVVNLDEGDGDTNYGDTIASILLSEDATTSDDANTETACSLLPESSTDTVSDAPTQPSLSSLLSVESLTDAETARAGVEDGTYAVAVIIPPNFSSVLAPNIDFANPPDSPDDITITPVELEIYANGAEVLYAEVTRSVVVSISNQIVTGTTAINATITTTLENPLNAVRLTIASDDDFADFSCGFLPETST
ncbi:MAG: ABC transporter permease, partial [Chloroflexota bacterium]